MFLELFYFLYEYLSRAFKYGNGRVITGYHWQSDVDMGRLVGAAAYARMHTNQDFMEQLDKAKKEFNSGTSVRAVDANDSSADIYNMKGVRIKGKPSQSGVYIQGNKKVIY